MFFMFFICKVMFLTSMVNTIIISPFRQRAYRWRFGVLVTLLGFSYN